MTSYAASIRGIMPMNPNHANAKLRRAFEDPGFANVQSDISSGNVIFDSASKSPSALEAKIEKALSAGLGIRGATHVRSREDLERIIAADPFKGKAHSRETYLLVTFKKDAPRQAFNEISVANGPTSFMSDLEKKYGKDITTRTWKTVNRIVEKMK